MYHGRRHKNYSPTVMFRGTPRSSFKLFVAIDDFTSSKTLFEFLIIQFLASLI